MRIESKQFEGFFAKDCVKLTKDEILQPTRVVYRFKGTITTRVFPTQERAWTFAMSVKGLIVVQDVKEKPPEQSDERQASNEAFIKYGRGVKKNKSI